MEIIKPGILIDKDTTLTFNCNLCGCIFKANHKEFSYDYANSQYLIRCPYCKQRVTLNCKEAIEQLRQERSKER